MANPLSLQGKVPKEFHGKKGVSGRKKNPRNVMRYLTEQIDAHWPELVERLVRNAIEGDKELLQYCFDRRLGKPKATTEIDLGEGYNVAVLVKLLGMIEAPRPIEGGEYAGQIAEGTKEEG